MKKKKLIQLQKDPVTNKRKITALKKLISQDRVSGITSGATLGLGAGLAYNQYKEDKLNRNHPKHEYISRYS